MKTKPFRSPSPRLRTLATDRRRFLRGLGLTAASGFLLPTADKLIGEAQGAMLPHLHVVFVALGNGWPPEVFDPSGHPDKPVAGQGEFSDPNWLTPLAGYRDRIVQVTRLKNDIGQTQHGAGFQMLSCVETLDAAEKGGAPGAATFDQMIAKQLFGDSAVPSLLVGVNKGGSETFTRGISASGKGQPEPFLANPELAYERLFGNVPIGDNEKEKAALRNGQLFDTLRADIKRLESRLAGPEREKMQRYLEAVQQQQKSLAAFSNLSCDDPPNPTLISGALERRLPLLYDLGTAGLMCGITNCMVGLTGHNNSHQQFPRFDDLDSYDPIYTPMIDKLLAHLKTEDGWEDQKIAEVKRRVGGHGHESARVVAMDIFYHFHATMLARMLDQLAMTPEGDGTMADNTLIIMSNESAENHHTQCKNWPVAIYAGKNVPLQTGGRFIQAVDHNLADLWVTIGNAIGVEMDGFAAGSARGFKNEIAELKA